MATQTKRKQAQSKLVSCEVCNKQVRARGLAGHMRIKHQIVVETITRVMPVEPGPVNSTQVGDASDLSVMTKVVEQRVQFKKVETTPGRLARVLHFRECAHCYKEIGLSTDARNPGRETRFACEDCIKNYYPYYEHPNYEAFKEQDKHDTARYSRVDERPRLSFGIYPVGSLYYEVYHQTGNTVAGAWRTTNIYDSTGELIWDRITLKKAKVKK